MDFVRFEELVRNAFAVTREPALGLFVGQRLVASSHGMVGFAAMSSGSIREGFDLIARFSRLRTSMVVSWLAQGVCDWGLAESVTCSSAPEPGWSRPGEGVHPSLDSAGSA